MSLESYASATLEPRIARRLGATQVSENVALTVVSQPAATDATLISPVASNARARRIAQTFSPVASVASVAAVADLAIAYAERMAICLEAGDISEAEARITAVQEVGEEFVRRFVEPAEVAPCG